MTRPPARRGEGDRTKADILRAAERLLIATNNEDEVSIRALADAIGVTPAAIYRHFPDKASLLFAVCTEHFVRLEEQFQKAEAALHDPVDRLAAIARAYFEFGRDNPEHYRVMFMGRSTEVPDDYATALMLETSAFGHLMARVQDAIDAGLVRADLGGALPVALALWAGVHGITSLAVAKPWLPGPPPDELLELLLDIQLRGILA